MPAPSMTLMSDRICIYCTDDFIWARKYELEKIGFDPLYFLWRRVNFKHIKLSSMDKRNKQELFFSITFMQVLFSGWFMSYVYNIHKSM